MLTYLPGAVYELYTVDDIYSADGTKLLDAGTKLATSSTTNASGFTWFDVDVPIRGEYYIDPAGPRSTSRENSGRYRIVEITAPAGYLLDSTPMEVSFTYEGQQIAWQVVDATNTNLRTGVDISCCAARCWWSAVAIRMQPPTRRSVWRRSTTAS